MNEIILNLAGYKFKFRYSGDFSVVEIWMDIEWVTFRALNLPCGTTLDKETVINIIKHKIAQN